MMTKTLKLPQVIAVDGPSASGKGTLSRRMARDLGYIYVDSGAMYRTLAWYCLQRGIRLEKPMTDADEKAVIRQLRSWKWQLRVIDAQAWIHVDGYYPATEIRTDVVEKAVPVVAQIGKVRDWMVARQRDCAALGPLVMEGRDIGTEVSLGPCEILSRGRRRGASAPHHRPRWIYRWSLAGQHGYSSQEGRVDPGLGFHSHQQHRADSGRDVCRVHGPCPGAPWDSS